MEEIYVWPDGTWAFKYEIWKPEPGYATELVSDLWPDERIDAHVRKRIDTNRIKFPK